MSRWDKALDKVHEIAEPLAHTMGFEVLLIEEFSDRGRKILRVFLDKPGSSEGITVDECAQFSRALDPILEVEAEIEGRYHLEISSPGLDRPLVKPEHFRQHLGEIIRLGTIEAMEGRKKFKGFLQGVYKKGEGILIKLRVDQKEFNIPWENIKRAQLDYFATEEARRKEKKE